MDFLDPKKQRAHMVRLMVGYVLIGLAVLTGTIILLYQAYGFGLGKDGEVVQKGVVFVASEPDGADILLNGQRYKDQTDSRLQLAEGNYDLKVRKAGYREWQRRIGVLGGTVSRFDYPLLVPNTLAPTAVKTYAAQPGFASQTPDRRWLIVQQSGSVVGFDVYDLGDPEQAAARVVPLELPESVVTLSASGSHAWKLVEWSTDNRHVVLRHTYASTPASNTPGGTAPAGGSEYILLDREEPQRSLNLTRTLGLAAGQELVLRDKKFDKYYVYDPAARTVNSASVQSASDHTPVLSGVLAFKPYGENLLLYATDAGAPAGKVITMLRDGEVTYKINEVGIAAGPGAKYLLDLARYDGDWYVAVGSSNDNKVFVYANPQAVRRAGKIKTLLPVEILRVTAPNYLSFSSNTRFVMIQNATSFGVYDAETDKAYTYATARPLDPGIEHASWMDGHRISYVSGGKAVMFDYDNINFQTLVPASQSYLPFFDRDYRNLYTIAPPAASSPAGQFAVTVTPLLTEDDL